MKDHEKRELVSELVGIASIAHGTEQLRDRIAYALSGVFSAIDGVTGRADKAEAELARLREQKPVRWHVRGNYFHDGDAAILFASRNPMCGAKVEQLYAAPAPAVAAPVVPEDYRQALVEIALRCTDHDATDAIDALLQSATQSGSDPVAHHPV